MSASKEQLKIERLRAGLRKYVAAGGKLGRPPKPLDWKQLDALRKHGATFAFCARVAGVSARTMSTRLRAHEAGEKE